MPLRHERERVVAWRIVAVLDGEAWVHGETRHFHELREAWSTLDPAAHATIQCRVEWPRERRPGEDAGRARLIYEAEWCDVPLSPQWPRL